MNYVIYLRSSNYLGSGCYLRLSFHGLHISRYLCGFRFGAVYRVEEQRPQSRNYIASSFFDCLNLFSLAELLESFDEVSFWYPVSAAFRDVEHAASA